MRHTHHRPILYLLFLLLAPSVSAQTPSDSSWQEISRILGAPPADGGGYTRFNIPRKDLNVRVAGVSIPPGFAFTSWVGFDGSRDSATAMGDLVLTAAELKPVLGELGRQGVSVTAIHNHLVDESPRIVYVHFHVMGPALKTAHALDAALRLTGAPRPVAAAAPGQVTIDTARVFTGLGKHGKASGAMAQVSFVLVKGQVVMHDHPLLAALAYSSPINVLQVSPSRFVATGDFAVTGDRLAALLNALAAGGVTATAVHNHLVGESPTVYFVHFWGDAPLDDLTRSLRSALDAATPE